MHWILGIWVMCILFERIVDGAHKLLAVCCDLCDHGDLQQLVLIREEVGHQQANVGKHVPCQMLHIHRSDREGHLVRSRTVSFDGCGTKLNDFSRARRVRHEPHTP
eukprot:CAMPEP_0119367904 /NCGR_PEP_ID=MMETSP1334-20130426/14633_1 /TAXON_ID=127549 /ORGANISM="Calcidiscus leptoporus, Strain RCC1130" /LENGTH=105 /DNA_ID=CAMNT_0007384423 /DNA_START=264 /DNA_END=581 /DNA_ORIENTATION=-